MLHETRKSETQNEIINLDKTLFSIEHITPLIRIPIEIEDLSTQALVDTGAAASFISFNVYKQLDLCRKEHLKLFNNNNNQFKTVSGELIKTYGRCELHIKLATGIQLKHYFHILDKLDEACILGIDFLNKNNILIDLNNQTLSIHNKTRPQVIKIPRQISSLTIAEEYKLYNITDKQAPVHLLPRVRTQKKIPTPICKQNLGVRKIK